MINRVIFLCIFACLAFSVFAQEKEDARELFLAGNYNRSIEVCLEELKTNPSRDTSYIVLGWGLIKQKRYQEAVDYMSQGLRYVAGAQNIWIIKNLAEAYYYLGRNDEALGRFEMFVNSEAPLN